MNKNIETGKIGEEKACEYLMKKGYQIINRNYWKKFGEIDIVARAKDKTLVFIEVKTLLMKSSNGFMPEDNFTTQKYRIVKRTCSYFAANHPELIDDDLGWRMDLIAIEILPDGKFSIRHYENV